MGELWGLLLLGALSSATPLVLAGVGEVFLERAGGGFNLGIEGTMSVGALAGVLGAAAAGPGLGLLAGAAAGVGFGALYAVGAALGADILLVGFTLTLLGVGTTGYLAQIIAPPGVTNLSVATLPHLGPVSVATWLAAAAAATGWWVLHGTRFGIRLRACGDNPDAAVTHGISVVRHRTVAGLIAGTSAGLGGAVLALASIGTFTPGIVGGRGFIALAVVIIARRTPLGVLAGAALFGGFDSLALLAQTHPMGLPIEAYQVLPYLVTFVLLCHQAQQQLRRTRRVPEETE
ncbi:ABC transporter permease [Amycolatopsis tolypomycina]|uniref:ABC transporter permease n=1 Tax=Amycolatopsis tolypomycina TaxID=208445 RepID=UPI0033B7457E